MRKLLLLVPPLLMLMISSAWAAETLEVEEVVVTASRLEEPEAETTSAVTVITAEEIERLNVQLVPEVLSRVADLNLSQNGGKGTLAEALLRGGAPKHTLVMIDGVKVNSPTTGGVDFSSLSVDDIERIEIVKGPQSTMYGSEAMAGVINIITKKGKGKPKVTLSAEGGSFGTYKPSVSLSGGTERLNYRLTGSYFHTDGISSAASGTEDDSAEIGALSGKAGARLGEKADLEVAFTYGYDRTELDQFDFFGRTAVDDPHYVQWRRNYTLLGNGKVYLAEGWEQVLKLSTAWESLRFRNPDVSYLNSDITTRINTVDWQHNLYLADSYTLTAGAEYRTEHGENEGNFDDTVDNKALYLNNKLKLLADALVLNAGLRYDDHETFGSKTTYRVGALVNIEDAGLRIRGSYGTGFRAPALNELFFPFYGNPALKPEESTAWEVGLEKDLADRATVFVTYFAQDYENLIEADPFTFTAQNIAEARIRGVETGISVRVAEGLDAKASYTYLDAEDKATGEQLTRRPKDKVVVSAAYACGRFSAAADYTFVGRTFDSTVQRFLDSYSVVNLSGSFELRDGITLFARVENLFDEDYETAGTFAMPGVSGYGGVKAEF